MVAGAEAAGAEVPGAETVCERAAALRELAGCAAGLTSGADAGFEGLASRANDPTAGRGFSTTGGCAGASCDGLVASGEAAAFG
jgi:hypothetical protein